MIDDLLNMVTKPIKTKNEEDVASGMKEALNKTKGEPSLLIELKQYTMTREIWYQMLYKHIRKEHEQDIKGYVG